MRWRRPRSLKTWWLLSVICLGILLTACRSTRIVTVPEYHELIVHQHDTTSLKDSTYVHDSIFVEVKGDTVRVEKYNVVYRDRWHDRQRTDSFVQRDTITVVKEVAMPLSRWQKAKMRLGTALLGLLLIAALILCFKNINFNAFFKN